MIAAVIDRLKAMAPSLVAVLPAEDLAALGDGVSPQSGTAFVMPYQERGHPNELMSGAFRQMIDVQLLVAFVVRRHDDAKGGKKVAMFDTFKTEIEAALAGWEPTEYSDAFELVSAKAAPFRNGASIYVQTWQTSRLLEGA